MSPLLMAMQGRSLPTQHGPGTTRVPPFRGLEFVAVMGLEPIRFPIIALYIIICIIIYIYMYKLKIQLTYVHR